MPKQKTFKKQIFSNCIKALLLALLVTIGVGYLTGFKAILVEGWSAQPYIQYRSMIVIYKCDFNDLKVGDFVTYTRTGQSFITHQIACIDYETGEIICKGWEGDTDLKEYQLQNTEDKMTYDNIVGKVIFSNFMIGNSIFTIKENMLILVGLFAMIVLIFIVKEQYSELNEYE